MSAADAVFNQVDLNKDGRVDLGEFRNFVGQNLGVGATSSWDAATLGAGAGWTTSVVGGTAGWSDAASFDSAVSGAALGGVYDASYVVGGGLAGAGLAGASLAGAGLAGGVASYETVAGSAGVVSDAAVVAGGAVVDGGAVAVNQVQYAADAQGIYQDPNPQIIRRPNPTGVQTYTQNIRVRFLQPPPVPAPGPLIIREVRPPQPPLPPPLRLRQVAPPLPTPPPLVLRERPPVPPPVIASQTVIRRLPGIPVPPRSVIIERLPAAPPKPRDIIIERWIPYGPQAKRRTLVQRAAAPAPYPAPRNVIIQYEQAPARIVRQFHRLGVVQANPAAYVQTYGAQLLDAATLLSTARAAGVVEDITAPGFVGYSGVAVGAESLGVSGVVTGANLVAGGAGAVEVADAGVVLGGGLSSSSWESTGYTTGGLAGLEAGYVAGGLGAGGLGASYVAGGLGAGYGLGYGGLYGSSAVVSGADAAFLNADTNFNGTLERDEFKNLLAANL